MKKILLYAFFNILLFPVFGQIDIKQYSTSYAGDPAQKSPMLIIARLDDGMYTAGLDQPDAFPQSRNDSLEKQKDRPIYDTCDSSGVHLFVQNIFRNNANNYEFRILEDQEKGLNSWQPIRFFAADSIQINNFKKGIAYLGGFKIKWNKYLFIEIRDKKSLKIVEKLGVYGQQIKPEILTIYTIDDLNTFFKRLKEDYNWGLNDTEKKRWVNNLNNIDSMTFLPKNLVLEPKEDNLIFYLKASIFDKKAIEYQVLKDGKVLFDWQPNDFDNNFIWLKNLEHGNYKLLMRFAIQRHNISDYSFTIKPEWYNTKKAQHLLNLLVSILFFLAIYFLEQRETFKKAKKEKQRIDNELKAIRSQLNPHFVFNALSSIQGLMNNNKLTSANYYLTAFSTLLRDSLQNGNKEFVPLSIELKTLETYIKLENLRFPFTFSLEIDNDLNIDAIEIPYLLLQPLVENAIKHGVSNLYDKGKLQLHIYDDGKNLKIDIQDNGKGFNTDLSRENREGVLKGYGLKLTKERIRLLNQSNPEQAVSLTIKSNPTDGTNISLTFENWL